MASGSSLAAKLAITAYWDTHLKGPEKGTKCLKEKVGNIGGNDIHTIHRA